MKLLTALAFITAITTIINAITNPFLALQTFLIVAKETLTTFSGSLTAILLIGMIVTVALAVAHKIQWYASFVRATSVLEDAAVSLRIPTACADIGALRHILATATRKDRRANAVQFIFTAWTIIDAIAKKFR